MLFITGDIHGNPDRLGMNSFPEQKTMTREDVVIICGDFGLVWECDTESRSEKYWLRWLQEKPFTTVFADGNHENFPRLYSYPVKEWNGGLVHEIRPNVLHLMRGEMFNICEKKIFVFGGARSHDISDGLLDPVKDKKKIRAWSRPGNMHYFRVIGKSWWPEEMPSEEEMQHGRGTLEKHGWTCDYIVSHDGPSSAVALLGNGEYEQNQLNRYLEMVREKTNYRHWFFGHYHDDLNIESNMHVVYQTITQIA